METKTVYLNSTLEDIRRERARRGPDLEKTSVESQAEHCTHWIRSHCVIQDPAAPGGVLPFDLYDYQEEFIRIFMSEVAKARRGGPAGIRTEKSRQMGDSWLMMAIELYTLRFWRHFRALTISRKEQKVDDGGQNSTTDSLFGKIRFMYERLPEGERFPLEIKHLSLLNPETGATIIGEAASTNAGRGGTFLYGLWDETASTEHSFSIYSAWEQAVRCPHYLSTPQGKSNFFAYSKGIDSLQPVRHHWSIHPVKGAGQHQCQGGVTHPGQSTPCPGGEWRSPWYEEQCARLPPELVAQELDISYERSTAGRAFPEFDATRHGVPDLGVERGGVFVASIDPGVTTAAAVLLQFVDVPGVRECRVMDAWRDHDATAATYAKLITLWQKRFGPLQVTGDPSGFNRGLTYGESVFGELSARYQIHVVAAPRGQTVGDRVRLVRDFMAQRELGANLCGRFAYRAELEEFARALEEAKWPTDREGRVTKETDLANNEAEHTADALCYGVSYYCQRSQVCSAMPSVPPSRCLAAGWRDIIW
jgi:hypothetical protein